MKYEHIADKELFTPTEAAEILDVSRFTVLNLLREGHLKGFRIIRRWKIKKSALIEFMKGDSKNDEDERDDKM